MDPQGEWVYLWEHTRFGFLDATKAVYHGPIVAVLNASSPVIHVPTYYWDKYLINITTTMDCYKSLYGYYMCPCNTPV